MHIFMYTFLYAKIIENFVFLYLKNNSLESQYLAITKERKIVGGGESKWKSLADAAFNVKL